MLFSNQSDCRYQQALQNKLLTNDAILQIKQDLFNPTVSHVLGKRQDSQVVFGTEFSTVSETIGALLTFLGLPAFLVVLLSAFIFFI